MKIDDASYVLESTHRASFREQTRESLRVWHSNGAPTANSPQVTLSPAAQSSLAADSGKALDEAADAAEHDPYLQLLIAMVELLTGRRMRIVPARQLRPAATDAAEPAPAPAPAAGFGVTYDVSVRREETEQTLVSARGVARTVDGRDIAFTLDLTMSRRFVEESSLSVRLGDAARKDPLVLNFGGSAARLEGQRLAFDIDADGQNETLPTLAAGSGYLAFDRNGNGRIDDGRELFGPASGSGFTELARLDEDGNGWIDEGDAAFRHLALWTPGAGSSGSLASLAAQGVGAIALGHVASPFALRSADNADLGAIAASGVFLTEDGRAGSVQEIDLTV